MRVSQHVELLLRQGHKPRELIQLGFSKNVVSRVRRKLKMEKAAGEVKVPPEGAREDAHAQEPVSASSDMTQVLSKLESLESKIQQLESRVEALETLRAALEDVETRINGTPALGLKHHFRCDCGSSGFVALRIKCTKCNRETWCGWFPK